MKFIIDNQLPAALAKFLRNRGLDCQHVLDTGLASSDDLAICRFAELEERIIISKDEDFFFFAKQPESPLRLVWVRLGNCRTATLLKKFEATWTQTEAALNAGERIVEIR